MDCEHVEHALAEDGSSMGYLLAEDEWEPCSEQGGASGVTGRAEVQADYQALVVHCPECENSDWKHREVHSAYDYAVVEILRVVDGDTVDARVETGWEDKGFHVEVKTRTAHRFRLIGVDTPERGQPGWAEATEFTQTWLVGPLRVRTHKSDSFGRWIGEFYDPVSRRTLGAALLEAGHARVWPA